MSVGDWLFVALSVVGCAGGMVLSMILYRNWNLRRMKSCDWCDHFCTYPNGDEVCRSGDFIDELVPFVRTCFSFKKRVSKGSWELGSY